MNMKLFLKKWVKKSTILTILLIIIIIGIPSNFTRAEISNQNSINKSDNQEHPWPMFRQNLKHTGRTQYTGPPTPTLAWKYITEDVIVSSAAIAADETIYFGGGFNITKQNDPNLYAIHSNGTLKWKYEINHGFFSSPAIGPDNTIYITAMDGYLYAIKDKNNFGELQWKQYLGFPFNLCSPSIWNNETIHVGSPSFDYYQINLDGTPKWTYETDWCIISSPAIANDGTVYIGSKDHYLYAFDTEESKLKWKFATGEFYDGHLVDSSPAIGPDGTIYVGTDPYGAAGQTPIPVPTNFWAINPDGTLKWVFETEDGVESSPAIGSNGVIYFGSYDGYLYAVEDNGTQGLLKWKFKTDGPIDGSPIVDADGVIYFASRDSYVYALFPNGAVKWKFKAGDGFESSPSIDANGYLYIGSFDRNFYCIGTGNPDVGVASNDIPHYLLPGATINPEATINNYRGADENFDVTCIIKNNNNVVYEDTINVNIPGGESKQQKFSLWEIGTDLGLEYNITIKTIHPNDENPYNNNLTIQTIIYENIPPEKPVVNGPTDGKIDEVYEYTFSSTDPNNDDIYFYIDWGDGELEEWIGLYKSGEELTLNHTWTQKGRYTIKVKAKDTYSAESEWETLSISMQKSKPIIDIFFQSFHELPMKNFPLIRRLFNL